MAVPFGSNGHRCRYIRYNQLLFMLTDSSAVIYVNSTEKSYFGQNKGATVR